MPNEPRYQKSPTTETDEALSLLHDFDFRLQKIEETNAKSSWKAVTDRASLVALLLGLILTASSLYDAFVLRPEANRLDVISKFNEAINAAAKVQQEQAQAIAQAQDAQTRMAIQGALRPQMFNDLATAKSLLPRLDNSDVDVPQLIVLLTGAFDVGDLASAKIFAERAINRKDASPSLRSEAERFQAHYFFLTRDILRGRDSFSAAVSSLGQTNSAAPKAYAIADWISFEYMFGSCAVVAKELSFFNIELQKPEVTAQQQNDLRSGLVSALNQIPNAHNCPASLLDHIAQPDGSIVLPAHQSPASDKQPQH